MNHDLGRNDGNVQADRPLTIALVLDTVGNRGNGTSNSALQWAQELRRQGHTVRLVGIGAPQYSAKENHVPLVSWIASKQQMRFAKPDTKLFKRAFDGVDVVHVYMPFNFSQQAVKVARDMGIPVTAGFHIQPENILYSAGPLRHVPGMTAFIYRLFWHWLYSKVDAIHVPTQLGAQLLRQHGYRKPIRVISNGFDPRFTPKTQRPGAQGPSVPVEIVASGRLSNEKNQVELIHAISRCNHAPDIHLTIAGTGPIAKRVKKEADRLLERPADIGFHANVTMPELLHSSDLICHPSIADLESVSVIEAMASGLVPVISDSAASASGQFALCNESSYVAGDVEMLAQRIDWWIDHPEKLNKWGAVYARHTQDHYSVALSVRKFVEMEREVLVAR
ncbi:glycosyltransferase [Bifidobacterium magnum]|uniref:Glycosyltransferase n=1 Tax=Bifidobacterium magnum TaxID=1692 RepID=A0A087BE40_9BIFI|nr:glycosyltransferase [Bifidobacterium magnum]KFI69290.1 Glycosyltransferase [Bifidobacterium magnum]